MRISLSLFKGMIPRVSDRLLPEHNATIARDCDLRSGEIRPFHQSSGSILTLPNSGYKTVFPWYKDGSNLVRLMFPCEADVVQGPVADDVWQRIYWTSDDPLIPYPRMAHVGGENDAGTIPDHGDMAGVGWKLGIPAPSSTLTIHPDTAKSYTITEIAHERPIRIVTAEPHGLITGELVEFDIDSTDQNPNPPEDGDEPDTDERSSLSDFLNGAEFQIRLVPGTDNEFTLDNTDAFNVKYDWYVDGGTVTQYWDEALQTTRFYVYTYVSDLGEEGPPSEPSEALYLGYTQGVTLDIPLPSEDVGVAEGRNIKHRRIYRTATGNRSAQFQFVGEIGIVETEFRDEVLGENLGESLPSAEYDPPPENLKGLRVTAQGFGVGFFDNVVTFSEPNLLHAWPTSYQLALDYSIVAVEPIDNGIVVATTGKPHIIQGIDPRSMIPKLLESNAACVSARSLVSMGYAALYATTEGLVMVAGGIAKLVTESIITEKEWRKYAPETIRAFAYRGLYVGFYNAGGGVRGGFIFDPRSPNDGLIDLSIWGRNGYVDQREGELYLLPNNGNHLVRWNDENQPVSPYVWRSKTLVTVKPLNMAVAKVAADNYPVTFRLYGDGILRKEKEVNSPNPFVLPARYLAREWNIECEGAANVQDIQVSDTYTEIE